jgi:type II secretory pathway predicted ATPase ExeA
MDYLKFYDLKLEPFKNDFSSSFYFESAGQRRARMRLLRGIDQKKGLSVLLGGAGCGKTTLAHNLLAQLDESEWAARMIVVPHSACAHGWLLPQLATQFGVDQPAAHIPQLLEQIGAQLVKVREGGQHPVLFVDEAQLFRNIQAMEEFRGILNFVYEGEKLISIVLFGLRELADVIALDPPLAQRVDSRVELRPMEREEASAYLHHRLECAGARNSVLSPDALEALYRYTAGVPRVLNTLADNALFEGFLSETIPLDASIVSGAADDLGLLPSEAPAPPPASIDPPAAPYVEGSGHSTATSMPPLPAPSALDVGPEEDRAEGDAPQTGNSPSSWENEVWEEPANLEFDSTSGSSSDVEEEEVAELPVEAEGDTLAADSLAGAELADEASGELELPALDMEELLQLPVESPSDDLAAALIVEERDPVLDSDEDEQEYEISPIEDSMDELELEEPSAGASVPELDLDEESAIEESQGEDSGFDLGSLLTERDDEHVDSGESRAEEDAEVVDAEPLAEEDDFESLFEAIQLPDD